MSERTLFILIFTGVWCGIGVTFWAMGLILLEVRRRRERRCTRETTGTVVRVERQPGSTARYPVFSYFAQGQAREHRSLTGSSWLKLKEGDRVLICYDPERPERCYSPQHGTIRTLGRVFAWVGVVCMALGLAAAGLALLLWR